MSWLTTTTLMGVGVWVVGYLSSDHSFPKLA